MVPFEENDEPFAVASCQTLALGQESNITRATCLQLCNSAVDGHRYGCWLGVATRFRLVDNGPLEAVGVTANFPETYSLVAGASW
jgi:hypothetical protein